MLPARELAAIRTTRLTKRYGSVLALDQLDLEVPPGELFCFLGPNGAGKTTTIKMLVGLVRPTDGSASIAGFDVQRQPLEAKRLLGYIPDTPYLYDKLTGREMLRLVAGLYRMAPEPAAALAQEQLERFEIAHVADRPIEGYSHGMRQKLSFAACFLHQPSVVVIDEPWVGLDPLSIRRIRDDLRRRTREGLTVLLSTHSLALAEQLADRVGILHRGRLLAVGSVADVTGAAGRSGTLEDVFLALTADEATDEAEAPPAKASATRS
jgi:ABC-2 type transport system ATP-binding protein